MENKLYDGQGVQADCVFCKIAAGLVSSFRIYEDEYSVAFLDIAGDVDGHMLVIPKRHVENILDCDGDTLFRLMDTVRLVSNHCVEQCGYTGVNLLNANGESAGQSVPHFHIHIIPRKNEDGVNAWPVFSGAQQDVETLYQALRMI